MKYSSSEDVNSNSQGCNILSNTYNTYNQEKHKEVDQINHEIISPKIDNRYIIIHNVFDMENRYIKSIATYTLDILNYELSETKESYANVLFY